METVLGLWLGLSLLVVLGDLALVGWIATSSPRRSAPVRVEDRRSPGGSAGAATIVVALERAEGLGRLGRHDERRCAL